MNAYKKERAAMMKKRAKVAKKPHRDCELCSGSGYVDGDSMGVMKSICPACDGAGIVRA